jgi:hypothetical protein
MNPARIEVDENGDMRVVREQPRRRLVPRRPKVPARWSDDEIRETIVAAYVGRSKDLNTAAFVLYCPAQLHPRKILRAQRKIHNEPWYDYQSWGFGWDEQMWPTC